MESSYHPSVFIPLSDDLPRPGYPRNPTLACIEGQERGSTRSSEQE